MQMRLREAFLKSVVTLEVTIFEYRENDEEEKNADF